MTNKLPQDYPLKFTCDSCDFKCCNRKDYNRHLLTRKHKIRTNDEQITPRLPSTYECECGKSYKHVSSLWNHKQKCKLIKDSIVQSEETLKECGNAEDGNKEDKPSEPMLEYLMKENIEMKKMMMDICHKLEPSSNITNNNINNHTNFNINIFLNEQCKDAMNLTDFIDSIQFTLEDMMRIGKEGQTNGFSNVLIDKLNAIDTYKRPVHCSDEKTETIYVKDENKWEKEKKGRPKLIEALDRFTNRSIQAMPCMEKHPDECVKTVSEVIKEPRQDKKIISNLAKNVKIKQNI